jgi:hypothetical protein
LDSQDFLASAAKQAHKKSVMQAGNQKAKASATENLRHDRKIKNRSSLQAPMILHRAEDS